ncbi:hypothetical protein T492DRAFT_839925 [Pavlovales sp. CCMP2436]|nr:hypothetical protein T492DRAFT_839925 [Pavlovales sp. CCMP2436]
MAGRRAPAVCNSFKKSWELCIAPGLARSASPNWWGQISFGSSTEKRLQTLACFTFSLYLLLPLIGWCWLAMFLLLINPLTLPFALAYLNFIFFFDSSPVDGKRGTFLRGSGAEGNWWRRYCDYFPMTIVKTAPLPATNKCG